MRAFHLHSLALLAFLAWASPSPLRAVAGCNIVYVSTLGSFGSGAGQFNTPAGVAVNAADQVYVADTLNHRVQMFDANGAFIRQWGALGAGDGQFISPTAVACTPDGLHIYVFDQGNNRIQSFGYDGTYTDQFGSSYMQLSGGSGLSVDSHGYTLVSDPHQSVAWLFSAGALIKPFYYGNVDATPGDLHGAQGNAVDASDGAWIVDGGNNRVNVYDTNNNFLRDFGGGTLNGPTGIGLDGSGQVFVTDTGNNRVTRWDLSGNLLGSWGSAGSGTLQFNSPRAIAVKGSDYYIADALNHRIQKFSCLPSTATITLTSTPTPTATASSTPTPTPTATTAAAEACSPAYQLQFGSYGTADGQLSTPTGLGLDAAGRVWVADFINSRIQVFGSDGSFVQEFGAVGTSTGQFSNPRKLAFGPGGTIYVLDTANYRVQRFSPLGGYIGSSGSYGTGNGQFQSLITGLAIDPASGNYYVTDFQSNRVEKFDANGVFLSAFGSAGSADGQFNSPAGIAVSGSLVYVADQANNRIQAFDLSGNFQSKFGTAGSGPGQLSAPKGLCVDPYGNLYVADFGNDRVQQFSPGGAFMAQLGSTGAGNGQFSGPQDVAMDGGGRLWVADSGNNRVQAFSCQLAFSATPTPTLTPTAVTPVSCGAPFSAQFDNINGTYPIVLPVKAVVAGSGQVFVTDGHEFVKVLDAAGAYQAAWGSSGTGNGQFQDARGMAFDSQGRLYVVDHSLQKVEVFSSTGVNLERWSVLTMTSPTDIAISGQDRVYVLDDAYGKVWAVDGDGHVITQWGGNGSGNGQFSGPLGVTVAPDGSVYVADTGNNRIQKFGVLGAYVTQWGASGSGNGQFNAPKAVAVAPDGSVLVADTGNQRVQQFSPSGTFLASFGAAGSGHGLFNGPRGLHVDAQGQIYVADYTNGLIQKFGCNAYSPTRSPSSTPSPSSTSTPTSSASPSPSATVTATATASPSASATSTATASPTASRTRTASPTGTATATPSATASNSPSASATRTAVVTATPSPSASSSPTVSPSASPTHTPAPTYTPVVVLTQVVTPGAAATVTLGDGFKIDIPSGAFGSSTVDIEVQRYDQPVGQGLPNGFVFLGKVYSIEMTGGTFANAVDITFPYDPADILPPATEQTLTVMSYVNGGWTIFATHVDTVHHTVTISTNHFSLWGVAGKDPALNRPTATPLPGSGGASLAIGPQPLRRGGQLCAASSLGSVDSFELYNFGGQKVSVSGEACLATDSLAPGLYIARVEVQGPDGSKQWLMKKVVIIP